MNFPSPASSCEPPFYDICDFGGDLTAFINFLDGKPGVQADLYIPSECAVTQDTTVPSKIRLVIPRGGFFSVDTNTTLTIQGPIASGYWPIFLGAGTTKLEYNQFDQIPMNWWPLAGDGVVDDADVFEMILACVPENSNLVLMPGHYLLGRSITLEQSVKIGGVSRDEVIIKGQDGARDGSIYITAPANQGHALSRVEFENLTFKNLFSTLKTSSSTDSTCWIEEVRIRGCKFSEMIYGTDYRHKVNRLVVEDCHFDHCWFGVLVMIPVDATIENNLFSNFDSDGAAQAVCLGIVSHQNHSRRVSVLNNKFDHITGKHNLTSAEVNAICVIGREVNISGNQIDWVQYDPPSSHQSEAADCEGIYVKCINAVIDGNVLVDAGATEGCIVCKGSALGKKVCTNNVIHCPNVEPDYAIRLWGVGGESIVSNNLVYGEKASGIIVVGITSHTFCNVQGNVVLNTQSHLRSGISVTNMSHANVSGNNIHRTTDGVALSVNVSDMNAETVSVQNNVVRADNPAQAINSHAIFITAAYSHSLKRVVVGNNLISDAKEGIMLWAGHQGSVLDDIVIMNNVFRNCETTIARHAADGGPVEQFITNVVTHNNQGHDDALSQHPFSNPSKGDIYLDDGTNTGGNPCFRYFNGSEWVNL